MIFRLPNPFRSTPEDPQELRDFFKEFKFIPYYGNDEFTSHTTLNLYKTLGELSPTFTGILGDINTYAFGLNLDISAGMIPHLKIDIEEIPTPQQVAYDQYLKGLGIGLGSIIKLSKRLNTYLTLCGNAYLIVRRVMAGGQPFYFFDAPHFLHTVYILSQDTGERFLLVSPFLGNLEQMERFPPKILPVSRPGEPLRFAQTGDGIEEAILHIKNDNEVDDGLIYNRPYITASLPELYVDYELSVRSSKIVGTDIISKKLIAFEGPDPDAIEEDEPEEDEKGVLKEVSYFNGTGNGKAPDGYITGQKDYFKRNMLILKQLTTMIGQHPSIATDGQGVSTVAGIEYPRGSQPPTVIALEMNRDVKYHEFQERRAVLAICAVMRWAPELISNRPAKATLGGNLLYDIFTMKNETTIKPLQVKFQNIWNEILQGIVLREGGPQEFSTYGILYPDVITEMIESFKGGGTPGQASADNPAREINNAANDDEANTNNP